MKKKLIAVLLTASMVLGITACGGGNSGSSSGSSGSATGSSTGSSNDGVALQVGQILIHLNM